MPELIKPTRRGFITGLVALVAAPAIIRASSLMPINSNLIPSLAEGYYIETERVVFIKRWVLKVTLEEFTPENLAATFLGDKHD